MSKADAARMGATLGSLYGKILREQSDGKWAGTRATRLAKLKAEPEERKGWPPDVNLSLRVELFLTFRSGAALYSSVFAL